MVRRLPCLSSVASVRGGFTLLELLAVVAILALIAGMSWPSFERLLNRSRVQDAAKQVRTELGEARLRAIESGRPQEFRFQPGTGLFEVRPKEEEAAGPAVLKSALEQMSDESGESEPISGAEVTDTAAYERYLPQGMVFAGQEVAKEPAAGEEEEGLAGLSTAELTERQTWSEPILFYPNGRSSNARIRVTDGRRYAVDVSLRGLTGTVRVGPASRIEPATEQGEFGDGELLSENLEEAAPTSTGTVSMGGQLGPMPVEAQP